MATLREAFNRDVMLSYRNDNPIERTPLFQTGAFTTDNQLNGLLRSGISTFGIPHINPIDTNLEANYGNTVYTDLASPRPVTGGKTQARAAFLNEGFLESSLERHLLGESPLSMIQGMIDNFWAQQAEHRALATVFGIKNLVINNAGLKDQFVTDVSKTSAATEASSWSVDAFIDAEATMARGYRGQGAIVVHPKIAAKMRKQNLIERVTTSADLPPVDTYNGRAVIESTDGTIIGTGVNAQYISYLLGGGAFAVGTVAGVNDLEIERTAATGNGAGHTALWTRRDMLIHPQGFSFIATDAQLTGGTEREALSASWTDLQNKDYWTLGGNAEQTSIRILVTNL